MLRLTGLWLEKGKTGEQVLTGKVTPTMLLLVLPNTQKAKASEPDYIAYLAEPSKSTEDGQKQEQPGRSEALTQQSFIGRSGAKYE